MRIVGTQATTMTGTPQAARRASGGGFSLTQADSPKPASSTGSLRTVGGIDTLLALQGAEDSTERRKRAVKRGSTALDALDALKIALLAGECDSGLLNRLRSAAGAMAEVSGEPGLDGVLDEIDLRLAVEIAKLSRDKSRISGPNPSM